MIFQNKNRDLMIERLYDRYGKMLYSVAYNILQNESDAEDAVQETFERVIKYSHITDENSAETKAYLIIICRNVAFNMQNNKLNAVTDDIDNVWIETQEEFSNPINIILSEESINEISVIIEKLTPIYQDVLLLKINHELTNKEIAEVLDISVSAVEKRFARAKHYIISEIKRRDNNE